ncbi:MAG: hypothetical protein ACOZCO_10640 [Bacteroidota bacterium]
MEKVEGEFQDYSSYKDRGMFKLTCDQVMNPYTWKPPIQWSGKVNGIEVKFVQTSRYANSRECFDFTGFPKELEKAIDDIIEAIDKKMRKMD